jgi:hypothetical protein
MNAIMKPTPQNKQGTGKEIPFFDCDVIVDIVFERGLFFIVIKNLSDKPVFKVSIKFDQKIIGVEGGKDISALPLFKNIEFLAPKKEIVTFLDTSSSYFKNRQPEKISLGISYLDSFSKKKIGTIHHDLSIYREIGFVRRSEECK